MIFLERKDRLAGGLADKSKPSDFDPKQLAMGVEVEMEHTDDPDIALEIAMDHLKEDPKYYTKLKKVHREGIMDVGYFVGLLENLHYELSEAGPPPSDPAARRAAGLPPLGGKDDETSKALASVRKMSKQSAADAKKAKTPPRLPKAVRVAKSEKARKSPEGLAREAHKHAKWHKRHALAKKGKGVHPETKKLGIKRSYSVVSAAPSSDDEKLRTKVTGRIVKRRASFGEAREIRAILESGGRYGGGPKLNPRERKAKGLSGRPGLPRKRSRI